MVRCLRLTFIHCTFAQKLYVKELSVGPNIKTKKRSIVNSFANIYTLHVIHHKNSTWRSLPVNSCKWHYNFKMEDPTSLVNLKKKYIYISNKLAKGC